MTEPTPDSDPILVPIPMAVPTNVGSTVSDRLIAIFVITSVVLNVVLIGCVVFLGIRNLEVANAEHTSTVVACRLANDNRSEDVRILNQIIALPSISHPQFITKANVLKQNAAVATVKHAIRAAYALRNCVTLYSK